MAAVRGILAVVVGMALHYAMHVAGGLAFVMLGKSPCEVYQYVMFFYIPFAVSGALLASTRGVTQPLVTAPLSAIIVAGLILIVSVTGRKPEVTEKVVHEAVIAFAPAVFFSFVAALIVTLTKRRFAIVGSGS